MVFARALAAVLLAAIVFVTCLFATGASAQTYPNRPVTLMVPFPPGGATDAIARIMQGPLEKALGQTIVIENVGGAAGMIAAARAARATPDGYTILIHQVALAAGVTLYPKLSFDAVKDFAPIGLVNTTASTLAASPLLPPNTLKELLTWTKEPGRTVKIAHAGVGSYGHLSGVLVAQELGMHASQIPYRGAGPAVIDLLSSQVDLTSISAIQAAPFAASGKLKVYAIIGRKRFVGMPDVPTLGELGYKKLDIDFWHMMVAPAATPRPIIDKLNAALRATLADATVQKSFADGGMAAYPPEEQTPEAAHALLKNEIKLWNDVINANQITAQSQ
jgi:tripartite-type tricarboxylate transporter receptor subunit TctC